MLKVTDLCWSYGPNPILHHLDFEAEQGEILGVLGENGAGKTTLLNLLAGITFPEQGQVCLAPSEEGLTTIEHSGSYRACSALLSDGSPVHPKRKTGEFLLSRLELIQGDQKLFQSLIELASLKDVWNQKMGTLSRGYRQRIGLVTALMQDPFLLLLDEPFTGLDPRQILQFRQVLKQGASKRITLFSSHILPEVHGICDRILLLDKGKIRGVYDGEELPEISDLENLFYQEDRRE